METNCVGYEAVLGATRNKDFATGRRMTGSGVMLRMIRVKWINTLDAKQIFAFHYVTFRDFPGFCLRIKSWLPELLVAVIEAA